jgi:hypothetical protein
MIVRPPVASWIVVIAACAAQASANTPREAAVAYHDALGRGDAEAARKLVLVPGDQVQRFEAQMKYIATRGRLDQAVDAKFEKPTTNPQATINVVRQALTSAEEKINGETATLEGPHARRLVRDGDTWRIDWSHLQSKYADTPEYSAVGWAYTDNMNLTAISTRVAELCLDDLNAGRIADRQALDQAWGRHLSALQVARAQTTTQPTP